MDGCPSPGLGASRGRYCAGPPVERRAGRDVRRWQPLRMAWSLRVRRFTVPPRTPDREPRRRGLLLLQGLVGHTRRRAERARPGVLVSFRKSGPPSGNLIASRPAEVPPVVPAVIPTPAPTPPSPPPTLAAAPAVATPPPVEPVGARRGSPAERARKPVESQLRRHRCRPPPISTSGSSPYPPPSPRPTGPRRPAFRPPISTRSSSPTPPKRRRPPPWPRKPWTRRAETWNRWDCSSAPSTSVRARASVTSMPTANFLSTPDPVRDRYLEFQPKVEASAPVGAGRLALTYEPILRALGSFEVTQSNSHPVLLSLDVPFGASGRLKLTDEFISGVLETTEVDPGGSTSSTWAASTRTRSGWTPASSWVRARASSSAAASTGSTSRSRPPSSTTSASRARSASASRPPRP